jgi:hypothetical protein
MPTEAQLRDRFLRALIRRRIDDGRLPAMLSKTISVSVGSGLECLACGQPITREQIEYHAFGARYGTSVRVHWGCHVLWQLECVERSRQRRRHGEEDPEREASNPGDTSGNPLLWAWAGGL